MWISSQIDIDIGIKNILRDGKGSIWVFPKGPLALQDNGTDFWCCQHNFLYIVRNELHVYQCNCSFMTTEKNTSLSSCANGPYKYYSLKGVEAATSCVGDQDAVTAPARHRWETGSLNWPWFTLQWFIRLPEFPFRLGKTPLRCLCIVRLWWKSYNGGHWPDWVHAISSPVN